jgi:hypothetical protein
MCETMPQDDALRLFDATELVKLKKRAMRSGMSFRALRRIDRVIINSTIKVTGIIRSIKLAQSIFALARKLEGIIESKFSRAMREVGLPLAQKLSILAQKRGNTSAKGWAFASSFMNFLAVMYINAPKTFKGNP